MRIACICICIQANTHMWLCRSQLCLVFGCYYYILYVTRIAYPSMFLTFPTLPPKKHTTHASVSRPKQHSVLWRRTLIPSHFSKPRRG